MNQDHLFLALTLKGQSIHALAVIRTDGVGNTLAQYHDDLTSEGAISLEAAVNTLKRSVLEDRTERFVVVGHYPEIYRQALDKNPETVDLFKGRAWLDTAQLAWPLVYSGALHARTIEALATYHGHDAPKTIFEEVDAVAHSYFEMMKRYKMAADVEQGIRRTGAKVIGSLLGKWGQP